MSKCDFCDEEAVGFTFQQMFAFCEDHEKEADERCSKAMQTIEIDEVIDRLELVVDSASHITTPLGKLIDYITELKQK